MTAQARPVRHSSDDWQPPRDKLIAYVVAHLTTCLVAAASLMFAVGVVFPHLPIAIRVCVGVAWGLVIYNLDRDSLLLDGVSEGWSARGAHFAIQLLTGLAAVLAGRRYAHLREAWAADPYDLQTGELLPVSRRLCLAAGDVLAAFRCRLDYVAELAWRPVDALLSSWHGSNLATFIPVTVAVGLVMSREGFYGLINDAENLGVIAAAPYAAIKGLRKYRQIDTPKRPEKKASPTDTPER